MAFAAIHVTIELDVTDENKFFIESTINTMTFFFSFFELYGKTLFGNYEFKLNIDVRFRHPSLTLSFNCWHSCSATVNKTKTSFNHGIVHSA